MSPRKTNPPPELRATLYVIGVSVFALTTFYGITTEESAALWLGLLGALLNLLALLNVSSTQQQNGEPDA